MKQRNNNETNQKIAKHCYLLQEVSIDLHVDDHTYFAAVLRHLYSESVCHPLLDQLTHVRHLLPAAERLQDRTELLLPTLHWHVP